MIKGKDMIGDDDGGTARARRMLRAMLDGSLAPEERRELALNVGEQALTLAHEGDTELSRALGMSLTLLAASMAHVAALEVELVKMRDDTGARYVDLGERLDRIEHACPGLGGASS